MKFISIRIHGLLDFVTVIAFVVIPKVFDLNGIPAQLSYALALIHLLMTLLTKFPFGVVKLIPVKLHKIVELLVGPILVIAPWVLGFSKIESARDVYVVMGLVIIVVGATTNYFGGAIEA